MYTVIPGCRMSLKPMAQGDPTLFPAGIKNAAQHRQVLTIGKGTARPWLLVKRDEVTLRYSIRNLNFFKK